MTTALSPERSTLIHMILTRATQNAAWPISFQPLRNMLLHMCGSITCAITSTKFSPSMTQAANAASCDWCRRHGIETGGISLRRGHGRVHRLARRDRGNRRLSRRCEISHGEEFHQTRQPTRPTSSGCLALEIKIPKLVEMPRLIQHRLASGAGRRISRPIGPDRLWPGSELQRQRVSPVVALAFALLLSRGVAALAIASARALAKQL